MRTDLRMAMFPLSRPCLPGEIFQLQVFEPRFISMVEHLRRMSEPEFGIVMIERGSEVGGGDTRAHVGTYATPLGIEESAHGRIHMTCLGTGRLRIEAWLKDDPHPWALVNDFPEDETTGQLPIANEETNRLADSIDRMLEGDPFVAMPPDLRLFALSSRLPIGALDRQRLLESPGRSSRTSVLIEILEHIRDVRRFIEAESD